MRPKGVESQPHPELQGDTEPTPEAITALNAELLRLAVETEALWSSFQDCRRDRVEAKLRDTNDTLVEACWSLIRFIEGIESDGSISYVHPDVLAKAYEEHSIACELLGKVIK